VNLESFFEPTSDSGGGFVPEVDPVDLEVVFQLCGGSEPTRESKQAATGASVFERACSPGADVLAVWYRAAMLQLLCGPIGLLLPWLHDGVLDKAVIRVAAIFPMEKMQVGVVRDDLPLNVQEFVKQIEAETKK
jgi:hypothetical protein